MQNARTDHEPQSHHAQRDIEESGIVAHVQIEEKIAAAERAAIADVRAQAAAAATAAAAALIAKGLLLVKEHWPAHAAPVAPSVSFALASASASARAVWCYAAGAGGRALCGAGSCLARRCGGET